MNIVNKQDWFQIGNYSLMGTNCFSCLKIISENVFYDMFKYQNINDIGSEIRKVFLL